MPGEEESHTQDFIRSHMMSILHPVAEHGRELESQVNQLSQALSATDALVSGSQAANKQHDQDVEALRSGFAQLGRQVEKLQAELSRSNREKSRLDTDHELTKADLTKAVGHVRSSGDTLKALQKKVEDMDADMGALRVANGQTNRSLMGFEEGLNQLRDLHEGLNGRQVDMVKDMGDISRFGVENHRNLQNFRDEYNRDKQAGQHERCQIRDHAQTLDNRLGYVQLENQAQADTLKNLEAQVKLLKASVEEEDGASRRMDALQTGQSDISKKFQDMSERLACSEAKVAGLHGLVHAEKDRIATIHKDMDGKTLLNAHRMDSFDERQRRQEENATRSDQAIEALQQGQEKLEETDQALDRRLQNFRSWQTTASPKIESNGVQVAMAQADMQQTKAQLESVNGALDALKQEIASLSLTLSKVSSRYDSCNKSIQGLSKGFADTFRHVVHGEHGMIAPKTSPGSGRLPTIKAPLQSPRTGSTGSTASP